MGSGLVDLRAADRHPRPDPRGDAARHFERQRCCARFRPDRGHAGCPRQEHPDVAGARAELEPADPQVAQVEDRLVGPGVDPQVERHLCGQPDRPIRAAFQPGQPVSGVLPELDPAWGDDGVEDATDEVAVDRCPLPPHVSSRCPPRTDPDAAGGHAGQRDHRPGQPSAVGDDGPMTNQSRRDGAHGQ